MFVDYAGPTLPVIDRETGDVQQAQVIVAVLGASNYTFAEAHPSQNLESFFTGKFIRSNAMSSGTSPKNLRGRS